MSKTMKASKKSSSSNPDQTLKGLEAHNSAIPSPVVPPYLAARLTGQNRGRQMTPENLHKDLNKAEERRMSLQADRSDRLRQHLLRVEKLAQQKKQQKDIPEEAESS